MTLEINNRFLFFSIRKAEDCLFSRRNGYTGFLLFKHSIFFTFKRKL